MVPSDNEGVAIKRCGGGRELELLPQPVSQNVRARIGAAIHALPSPQDSSWTIECPCSFVVLGENDGRNLTVHWCAADSVNSARLAANKRPLPGNPNSASNFLRRKAPHFYVVFLSY